MRRTRHTIGVVTICLASGISFAQTKPEHTSICNLQGKVAEGKQVNVQVSGRYSLGLDLGVLEDAICPNNQGTWVELALKSDRNKAKLKKLLDRSGQAYVVFEGEFYGPPAPDPNLPPALRMESHPGWGHLGAFKTKLVVHAIHEVAVVPPTKP